MAFKQQLYAVDKAERGAVSDSNLLLETGLANFTGTGLTVEVETSLTDVKSVLLTPVDPTFATSSTADLLYSDGVITSGAITVTRGAAGTSGLEFYFMFTGRSLTAA